MNYDDFVAWLGEPLKNKDGTILFETYGEDYEKVKAADPRCVWTVVDEGGVLALAPGLRFINRVNYVIVPTPRRRIDDHVWFIYGDNKETGLRGLMRI